MKRFFCSLVRTFSVDFLDLRQTFWQVVGTVKNLSRVVFEEFFFRGHSSLFVYLYLNIQQKALFLTKFLGLIIESALHVSKGTILDSFGCCENSTFSSKFWGETKKNVEIRSRFSAQFQNYIPRDQRGILRLSIFSEKLQNTIKIETWGKINLAGMWKLETICPDNFFRPLKKTFCS